MEFVFSIEGSYSRCAMLILRILVLILALRLNAAVEFSFSKSANNYGPYVMVWKKHESCQGPKSTDLTTIIMSMTTNDTGIFLAYNSTFHSTVRLSEIKIHVSHVNGAHRNTLWNYRVDKPCQHFAIASIMAKYLPVQLKTCTVQKAEVCFIINMTQISKQFFGESFFYGEFFFKVVVLSKQGNVMCSHINLEFAKKS